MAAIDTRRMVNHRGPIFFTVGVLICCITCCSRFSRRSCNKISLSIAGSPSAASCAFINAFPSAWWSLFSSNSINRSISAGVHSLFTYFRKSSVKGCCSKIGGLELRRLAGRDHLLYRENYFTIPLYYRWPGGLSAQKGQQEQGAGFFAMGIHKLAYAAGGFYDMVVDGGYGNAQ